MLFPQIFSAVGSSFLVINVSNYKKQFATSKSAVSWPGEGPSENFGIFFLLLENHKLIDSIFFIVRVRFSAMIHNKSNTKE